MRTLLISMSLLTFVFNAQPSTAMFTKTKYETYPYTVLKAHNGFEIRKYSAASFSYVTMNTKQYDKASSAGFRKLAGYIFGGNEGNQQIAMTTPVEMELNDQITMKFMIPSQYRIEDLPAPNDPDVKFVQEPEKLVAAIKFGGYASDKKIKHFRKMLEKILAQNAIQHNGEFSFMGYNSPFDFFNRRNEIVVELK